VKSYVSTFRKIPTCLNLVLKVQKPIFAKKIMGSIVATPKTAEELKFLIDLLQRLGIPAHVLSEEEEATFLAEYELSEEGRNFLEARAAVAAAHPEQRKKWSDIQRETASKFNWPQP